MRLRLIIVSLLVAVSFSCSKKEDQEPVDAFIRIYDRPEAGEKLRPLDLITIADGGYLVLARMSGWDIYLMKAEADGSFAWEQPVSDAYVNPVPGLFSLNGQLVFFAMEKLTLETTLMSVDPASGTVQPVKTFPELYYPLSVAEVQGGFLIHGYDPDEGNTYLSKIDAGLEIEWKETYGSGKPREEEIIGHISGNGQNYPFFTGEAGGNYYVNTFHQYNFNLLFINPSDGSETGVIFGFDETAGINSFLMLENENYAFSRFSGSGQFINPSEALNTGNILIADELPAFHIPELDDDGPVNISRLTIRDKDLLIFSGSTKSNNVAFYAFHASDASQAGTLYLGHTFPYTDPCLTLSQEGEPVVAAATEVAGKFSRLVLFKLNAEQRDQLTSK